MGGKRPDQHNIDPSEAGATDYKTRPQVGRGKSSRDDTTEGDRQRLAASEGERKGGQPFLPDVPAPSAAANRAAQAERLGDEDADERSEEDDS